MKRSKIVPLFIIGITLMMACNNCFAQTSDEVLANFDTTSFTLSYTKKDIPRAFRKHFKPAYNKKYEIANPDEDFYKVHNVHRELPRMHLIFTCREVKNGLGFLYYELVAGGIEWKSYLFISVYSAGKITKEIVVRAPNEVRDLVKLKQTIKEKNYKLLWEIWAAPTRSGYNFSVLDPD